MGYDSVGKEEFRALVKRVEALEDKLAEVKKPFLAEINRPEVRPIVALVANQGGPIITSTNTYPEGVDFHAPLPSKAETEFDVSVVAAVKELLGIGEAKRDVEPVQAEEKEPG